MIDAIEEFSLGLRRDFSDLDCGCRDLWRAELELQDFLMSTGDVGALLAR